MTIGRRSFTAGLAASALGAVLPAAGQTAVFVRRDAHSTGAHAAPFAAYARAVAAMKAKPASDPTSWAFQANVHGTYDNPTLIANDPRSLWNACQHGNWHFLSWHRMYLYYFERIVRAASGDANFALPYWNYEIATNRALPAVFREPTTNNPLYVADRNDGSDPDPRLQVNINAGAPLPASVVRSSGAMAAARFGSASGLPPGFTNLLESQPHNILHVVIGGAGLMSDPNTAAQDPIFWLHHANIDRLVGRWLGQAPHSAPTDAAWMDKAWPFYDEGGQRMEMTGRQIMSAAASLNYRYDDDPATPPITASAPPTETATATPVTVATAEAVTLDRSHPVRTALRTTPTEAGRVIAPESGSAPTYLTFEEFAYEGPQSTWYEVYLNAPSGVRLNAASPYFAGNLGLFGLVAHHGQGGRVVLDVSETLRHQRKAGLWTGGEVSVQLVPRGPVSATEAGRPAPKIGVIRLLQ